MSTLVFDSTALSHFARASRLAELEAVTAAGECIVLANVLGELTRGVAAYPALGTVSAQGWLRPADIDQFVAVSAGGGGTTVALTGLAVRPSSGAVVSPSVLLACCNDVIEKVLLTSPGLQPDGPLLESIGFIPLGWITAAGLGDTTGSDPSYFYQVRNVPFGGSLPVMINFLRASLDDASCYQVKVDGNLRTDQFSTAIWNGTAYVPAVFGPQLLDGSPGYYPVSAISDLMLYIQPLPGCYLDSTNMTSGQPHTITVDFYDSTGVSVESAAPLRILVDNNPWSAAPGGLLVPLAGQQPEQDVVGPLALEPGVRRPVSLSLETGPLKETRGTLVPRVALGRDPVQAMAEQVVNHRAHGLGGVAVPLPFGGQGKAQVGLHHVVVQPDPDVADEALLRPVLDGVLEPARLPRIARREFSHEPGGRIWPHRRHPALIPGDRRIRPVGRQRRGVGGAEAAQDEPGGFQQHDSSR